MPLGAVSQASPLHTHVLPLPPRAALEPQQPWGEGSSGAAQAWGGGQFSGDQVSDPCRAF